MMLNFVVINVKNTRLVSKNTGLAFEEYKVSFQKDKNNYLQIPTENILF